MGSPVGLHKGTECFSLQGVGDGSGEGGSVESPASSADAHTDIQTLFPHTGHRQTFSVGQGPLESRLLWLLFGSPLPRLFGVYGLYFWYARDRYDPHP